MPTDTKQTIDEMLKMVSRHAKAMGMSREDVGRTMILFGLCLEADRAGPAAVSEWLGQISLRFMECDRARPTSH